MIVVASRLLAAILAAQLAFAQVRAGAHDEVRTWNERAAAAQQALVQCFWHDEDELFTPTWPADDAERPFHYWWQAHALDALVDAFERSGERVHLERATRLWAGVQRRNGGVVNDYHDDMLWMALALLRLHAHTRDAGVRRDVDVLWRDVKAGWSDSQGGGIAWGKAQPDYKNTPANAPAVILAVRLHRDRGDAEDLAFAKRIYSWLDEHLVDPQTGFVWDGVNRKGDGRTDKDWAFSYNQGVRIGAARELLAVTGDQRFARDAERTFAAAMARLTGDDGVLRERGRGDGALFKGIFVRHVGDCVVADPAAHAAWLQGLRRQVERLWATAGAREPGQPLLLGPDWRQRGKAPFELGAHLSGVMLLEQMARVARVIGAARAGERDR